MNWKKCILILCACAPLMIHATDYKTQQAALKTALKKSNFEDAEKAAAAMVALSKDSAKTKAPGMVRTLNNLIKDLSGKPIFAMPLTKKYYEQLIALKPEGYDKELLKIQYAVFLHDFMQIDDAALNKAYDAALKNTKLTLAERVKIILFRAQKQLTHKEFAAYRDQALKLAGDDPESLTAVYQVSVMDGFKVRPDGHEWAKKIMNDKRIERALFGTINQKCRSIFSSGLGFYYPVKDRIKLLEAALEKKTWSKDELSNIYHQLGTALMNERVWKRYYADPDPVVLKKAYAARKKSLEFSDRVKPNMNRLVPLYMDLLFLSLAANDQKQFEADVAALEKECASVKDKWLPTVESYRVVFAYRQEDYQKAYDIGKTIDTKKFNHGARGSSWFMDAYARSACALELYNEAYALKDEYVRICVPNWYYQQKNRVKAQFENLKQMCK